MDPKKRLIGKELHHLLEQYPRYDAFSRRTEYLGISFHSLDIHDVVDGNAYVAIVFLHHYALRRSLYRFAPYPSERLRYGHLKPAEGIRLVKVVHRIEVETLQCIAKIGCSEDEACILRQLRSYVESAYTIHLNIEKHYIGTRPPDRLQPLHRVAEHRQPHPAEPAAEFIDDV